MPQAYKAKLIDNRIIWISKVPEKIKNKEQEVYITFTEKKPVKPRTSKKNIKTASILEELALANINPSIKDPVHWQKDLRKDRDLPGREE